MKTQQLRDNVALLISLSGLSDDDLAKALGVNRSNVNRWRHGKSTCSVLESFAKLWGIPIQTVCFGSTDSVTRAYRAWVKAQIADASEDAQDAEHTNAA